MSLTILSPRRAFILPRSIPHGLRRGLESSAAAAAGNCAILDTLELDLALAHGEALRFVQPLISQGIDLLQGKPRQARAFLA